MKGRILNAIILIYIIVSVIFAIYATGYNLALDTIEPAIEPVSDLFWIDSNRVHKDSVISCSPIYGESMEINGSWIRVMYEQSVIYIECVDTDDYEWEDFKESWLMAFKDGAK